MSDVQIRKYKISSRKYKVSRLGAKNQDFDLTQGDIMKLYHSRASNFPIVKF